MKVLLTTLNSQYVHTSLALRYLRQYAASAGISVDLKEYTINEQLGEIAADIHLGRYQMVAFACYIWNIEQTLHLAQILKLADPGMTIILGGPEVTYDPEALLHGACWVEMVVVGEGEQTLVELIGAATRGDELSSIPGLVFRDGDHVVTNRARQPLARLDEIPFPYTEEELRTLGQRILYYEASRGCPFNCQYCLSSTLHGVRFFSLERVQRDLAALIQAGVKQVKFVDRTFNCNKEYAMEIWRFLIETASDRPINFHFELAADLLDDEMIRLLSRAPAGLFQFEIGVQSTNPDALTAIDRRMDFAEVAERVRQLNRLGTVHLHLDLIAGLPGEDWASFGRSFDDVYALEPDNLQLGFLKLLKGSGLRTRADEYGFRYDPHPPYQVIASHEMSYDELIRLQVLEELLKRYGNSHRFTHSLSYLISTFGSPFAFFSAFEAWWRSHGHHRLAHKDAGYYRLLWEFGRQLPAIEAETLDELLKLDWCLHHRDEDLPEYLPKLQLDDQRERVYQFFAGEAAARLLPELAHLAGKALLRQVRVEAFGHRLERLVVGEPLDEISQPGLYVFFSSVNLRGNRKVGWRRVGI